MSLNWDAVRAPMVLRQAVTGLSEEAHGAIAARLGGGCFCGEKEADLVKRITARGVVTVCLQCTTCGSAVGGALKRDDHPALDGYPSWDEDRRNRFAENYRREAEEGLAAARERFSRERQQQYQARKADYAEWLRTSPQWRDLRGRVITRAGLQCEACLAAPATEVHHETYAQGRLPPAWALRAVCGGCHDRLHNAADEWAGA